MGNVTFDIELVKAHHDFDFYEYLCFRNALRVLLIGYNIGEPLFWMSCGLFLQDKDFSRTGLFSTSYWRSLFDPKEIPIIGKETCSLDWDIIDGHLEKDYPVLAEADVYYLPYKQYFHNAHGSHAILLLNKVDSNYVVLDWYSPDFFYGEVSKADIQEGRLSLNEKTQISISSGVPIKASYNLLFMNKLPVEIDLKQYIRRNLYHSVKAILSPKGALELFSKSCETVPEWLSLPAHIGYQNAIESFVFFDLELKILAQYYEKMLNIDLFFSLNPRLLLGIVLKIKESEELLKNKLIFMFHRKKSLNSNVWIELLENMNIQISIYCETLLKVLKI